MMNKALGLIETEGLVCALEAADAAVKAANVELLGYELTKGRGMVTVKFRGNVSAVQAAVHAGAAAGAKLGKVVSSQVIPRPHPEMFALIDSPDMVIGHKGADKQLEEEDREPEPETAESTEPPDEGEKQSPGADNPEGERTESEAREEEAEKPVDADDLCNLCGDPACPRRKGEPHARCLHHPSKEAGGKIEGNGDITDEEK